MPIDIKKLASDVRSPDVEVQTLALQTLLRMDLELVSADPRLLAEIREGLEKLMEKAEGDSLFFARQCLDHLERVTPSLKPAGVTAGAALSAVAAAGQARDLPAVLPHLRHADARVRANAVEAVERMATPEQLLFHLAPMVEDPADRVRA